MGSDPQSHLNEQNFLMVGERKITEADWLKAVRLVMGIQTILDIIMMKPCDSAVFRLVPIVRSLFLQLTRDVGARYLPSTETDIPTPTTAFQIEWAELCRRLNNVDTTLSFSIAEARQRKELFDALLKDIARIGDKLVERGLLK